MGLRKYIAWTGLALSTLMPVKSESKSVTLALSLIPTDGCAFSGAAETDPSWKNLKKVKVNGVAKLRHDRVLVEYYPAEITLKLTYGLDGYSWASRVGGQCASAWDPRRVQFSAAWRTASRTVIAKGLQLNAEWHGPGVWCESKCRGYWTYEIRLDSENIPITDELQVTVHTEDGRVASVLAGRLEAVDKSYTPTLPLP